jgi:hypothetical protein
LLAEVKAMGIPTSNWSDEKLNSYEAKIDKMHSIEKSLNRMDGVTTSGGMGESNYKSVKSELAVIRAHKAKTAQPESAKSAKDLLVDKIAANLIQRGDSIAELDHLARITSPTLEQIDQQIVLVDKIIEQSELHNSLLYKADSEVRSKVNFIEKREFDILNVFKESLLDSRKKIVAATAPKENAI